MFVSLSTYSLSFFSHEDGTLRFWNASGTTLSLLYRCATSTMFGIPDHMGENASAEEEEWPPFQKVSGCSC
jgi:lethal(2) giant larvae protein